MFDYMKLTKLLPTMCDTQKIKYARITRLSPNVEAYLEDQNIKPNGATNFINDKVEGIRIYIVYGHSDCAMLYDVIDNMHTFCIFADYILKDENNSMGILHIVAAVIEYISEGMLLIVLHKPKHNFIKNTFLSSINKTIREICIYNVWSIFGEKFLEEYTDKYPQHSKDLEKIMELYDQIE